MAIDKKAFKPTAIKHIKIHKDGLLFWFDFRIDNKRYSKMFKSNPNHSKADRLKTAFRVLENLRDAIQRENNLDDDVDADATVNNYWDILKRLKRNKWSDRHLYRINSSYELYIENSNIGKKKIKDIKASDLTRFNATMSHLSTRTQKLAYECLVPIFNLAIEDEIIIRTPIKRTHNPVRKAIEEKKIIIDAVATSKAVNKAIHKVFSKDPNDDKSEDRPDLMAIFLFCFHGRRWGETTKLHWEDIDFDNDTYIIRAKNSKVNVDMSFSIPAEVKEVLLKFRNTTGDVFPTKRIERHISDIRKEPGVPKEFTLHWLRNLYVSALSELGVEAIHLSAALGHTDTNTVKQYLSLQRKASTKTTNDVMEKLLKSTDKNQY